MVICSAHDRQEAERAEEPRRYIIPNGIPTVIYFFPPCPTCLQLPPSNSFKSIKWINPPNELVHWLDYGSPNLIFSPLNIPALYITWVYSGTPHNQTITSWHEHKVEWTAHLIAARKQSERRRGLCPNIPNFLQLVSTSERFHHLPIVVWSGNQAFITWAFGGRSWSKP